MDGDDVGNLLAAASAKNGQHGECLWKSASRALIRKQVSRDDDDDDVIIKQFAVCD